MEAFAYIRMYVCVYIYKYKHLYAYACVCVCVCLLDFSVCRPTVHNLFQSEFSTECDLVLSFVNLQYPLVSFGPSSSCLAPLPCLPVTASYLSFNNVF